MDHWRGTFRLWLYISIAFMVGHTLDLVRRDDTSLAESKLQLSGIVNGELARKEAAIGTITKEMDDKLSKERQSCAEMKGANGALEAQNKDQQNSINNCQNQAIARLQPLPFAFGVYRLDQFGPFDSGTKAHFLLTTNTTITHIGILATCNRPIKAALPWILTDTIPIGGEDKLIPPNKYSFSYGSPAWLPNNPIVFNVTYDGPGDIVCGFTRTS